MNFVNQILGPGWDLRKLLAGIRLREDKTLMEPIWTNIILIGIFHFLAISTVLFYWKELKLFTYLWGFFIGLVGGFGVTGGAHRLWAHRSFKAKLPLQVLLAICFTIAGQNTIYDWVRDHRVHHKFSETDADPHNAKRGFFFSHVGWLMCRKHREVLEKGKKIDMTDITSDPLLEFQRRYFAYLKLLLCFVLPTIVPPLFWGETWALSFLGLCCLRYICGLNFTWLVNSAAHIWGNKPYDKRIGPVENKAVALLAMGEGWHNYHHVFPYDYRAAELGSYGFNFTTCLLDFFHWIGWAYDMKMPSKSLVEKISLKYGDGTREVHEHDLE